MKSLRCGRCKEVVPETEWRAHTLDQCKAAGKTFLLIERGFRPLPATHSLPDWFPVVEHATRGAYDGEPRIERPLLIKPEPQFWIPRWADIVIELWSGPIYMGGPIVAAQRDGVLRQVFYSSRTQRMIEDAYREDLRAVRDLLTPLLNGGPAPVLLSELSGARRS